MGRTSLKEHEAVFVRKDGAGIPVACSSSPIISEGAVAGLVVVFRDVTRQKQAEQELRMQRTALPRPGGHDAANRVGGPARRLPRLLQPSLV